MPRSRKIVKSAKPPTRWGYYRVSEDTARRLIPEGKNPSIVYISYPLPPVDVLTEEQKQRIASVGPPFNSLSHMEWRLIENARYAYTEQTRHYKRSADYTDLHAILAKLNAA